MKRWFLQHPLAGGLLAALLVSSPTIVLDRFVDDYVHAARLQRFYEHEKPVPLDPLGIPNLFDWVSPERMTTLRDSGEVVWFAPPDLKIRLLRPLASLSAVIDYHVSKDSIVFARLHSLAWWSLTIVALWLVLRSGVGRSSLLPLALVLFAISDRHSLPVVWLANRHSVITTASALFGLWAHMRWRRRGWLPWLPLSMLGYALGLLGGESGVAVFAYVFAFEFFGRETDAAARPSFASRLLGLLPGIAVGACWLAIYAGMGYGGNSGEYVDPLSEPAAFVLQGLWRLPQLVGGLAGFPAGLDRAWPRSSIVFFLSSCLFAALWGLILYRAYSELTAAERTQTRWLLVGSLLSLAPFLAATPGDRLLMMSGIGACWVGAVTLRHVFRRVTGLLGHLLRAWGGLFVLRHFIAAPALWWYSIYFAYDYVEHTASTDSAVQFRDDPAGRDFMLVQVRHTPTAQYMAYRLALQGRAPATWFRLSMSAAHHQLLRTGELSFELECTEEEGMVSGPVATHYRGLRHPIEEGMQVRARGLRLVVLDVTDKGAVTRIRVEFDSKQTLESFTFLAWLDGRLQTVALPNVGEQLDFPDHREDSWLL